MKNLSSLVLLIISSLSLPAMAIANAEHATKEAEQLIHEILTSWDYLKDSATDRISLPEWITLFSEKYKEYEEAFDHLSTLQNKN